MKPAAAITRAREALFHRLHCEEQIPLREIARRHDLDPSTVLRSIRRYEDREDMLPPPPPPETEWTDLRHIARLHAAGKLTRPQALAAVRFYKDPDAWRSCLPSTMWRILNAVIVEEVDLGLLEARNGWAVRSAKVTLAVLLDMLNDMTIERSPEPAVKSATAREVEELREKLTYLTGDDPEVNFDLMVECNLTYTEARFLSVLLTAKGRVMTREMLLARMYEPRRSVDEWPELAYFDTLVFNSRKKLVKSRYRIETVAPVGYRAVTIADARVEDRGS